MSGGWHILGAGAIGGLFASRLATAGIPVTLMSRDPDAPPEARLTVRRGGAAQHFDLPQSRPSDRETMQQVLVATKAYDARRAVSSIAHRLDADSRLLLLVNGMGVREDIARDHPGLWIGCGTTTEGAWRELPLQLHHAGRGETLLGCPGQARAPAWLSPWLEGLRDCRWTDDIDGALWRKLAINCAINPLTALHGVPNGELAANPLLRRACRELVAEIAGVCEAEGQRELARDLPAQVDAVISATAQNRSSMLQDRVAGRPTELEYITGYLLRCARRSGLPVPANSALYERLRGG